MLVAHNGHMSVHGVTAEHLRLESRVGNPRQKADNLIDRIQDGNVISFGDIAEQFLDVLWCLDAYRSAGVTPRSIGPLRESASTGLASEGYRGKGYFFRDVCSLLLGNRVSSPLAISVPLQGYSQLHRVDISWPFGVDAAAGQPRVCCEAKMSGAPAAGSTPERDGRADWSSRRKELKFEAMDLKLVRGDDWLQAASWDEWRTAAWPRFYLLWAARVSGQDDFERMHKDAHALESTYLDGVGLLSFMVNESNTGYVNADGDASYEGARNSVDAVLEAMASEIETARQR